MTTGHQKFDRVLHVSEYYRYILKSHLLYPDPVKPYLAPDSDFGKLLRQVDDETETAVMAYPLDLPTEQAAAFKAFVLAMLYVKRHAGKHVDLSEFEHLKQNCFNAGRDQCYYRYNFAMTYLNLGEVDKCVRELVDAVRERPDFGQAHAALALLYTLNEDWSDGISHARTALSYNAEIRPQLVDLCLSSCSYQLGGPVEGAFNYTALDSDSLDINDAMALLPTVNETDLNHSDHDRNVLFIYADSSYFYEHAMALVCSLHQTRSDWVVHLHICNPDAGLESKLQLLRQRVSPVQIRYSSEHGDIGRFGDPRMYHSCVRFCRLHQLVSRNPNTFVMLDADMLIRGNPDTLSEISNSNKVIGLTRTACEPFWATIRAGFCFFKRSDAALLFLGRLSRFIIDNLNEKKGHWFIDQMGLSILYSKLHDETSVALLPAAACCDSTINDAATIWAIVNDKVSMGKYNTYKQNILTTYGLKR